MMAGLDAFQAQHQTKFEIDVVDVDFYAALEEKYGDKVPVLFWGSRTNEAEMIEICHYYLDDAKLRALVVAHPSISSPV